MTTLTDLYKRLIILSLNIHIELNNDRFSFSRSDEIRNSSDLSLISSSYSNTFIDELLACIEYYLHEVIQLSDILRPITSDANQILDGLTKGSQLCSDVLHKYHLDRRQAVQSVLLNPYCEDAWYVVYEIDSNIFNKCRIILNRLRIYFLLMYQILPNSHVPIKKPKSNFSLPTNTKKNL